MERIASPRLDLRDLGVVVALASTGNTTSAGATLHLSQSAVSRALVVAEEKIGVRLFDRTPRGLVPTTAGARLVEGVGPLLAQFAELEARVRSPEDAPTQVRVVCECYTAYRWLPSALSKLRALVPNLEVTLAVEHTQDPVAALVAGDIDVALLTTARTHSGVRDEPLFSDEIVFVVAASHPLAKRATVAVNDLCTYPLITSNTPPAEAKWFAKNVFGRKKPKVEYLRFPLTEAIVDAARAGMGIAVLSEWIASPYLGAGDLVAKRFASEPLRRPWRIAFRRDTADVAKRLVGALQGSAPRVYPRAVGR